MGLPDIPASQMRSVKARKWDLNPDHRKSQLKSRVILCPLKRVKNSWQLHSELSGRHYLAD
jgi:hypothetical protein